MEQSSSRRRIFAVVSEANMPRALTAQTNGTCARCGQPYRAGDSVTYSIKVDGERYHFPSCAAYNAAHSGVWTDTPIVMAKEGRAPLFDELDAPKPVAPVTLATRKSGRKPIDIAKIGKTSKWWDILEACLEAGLTRILLVGPPGTGKSTTADRDGLRVTCHEDAGPESIVGTFIQKDGNTIWIDGPAVKAMKHGSRIVLDETDHSSSENVSLLYALLDDAPSIVLPTGEQVFASPGYQVIGTSNSNPADFPDAILDRFEAVILATEPHPAAVDRVKTDAGDHEKALVGLMANWYKSQGTDKYDFRGNPTLRKCRNFAKLMAAGLHKDIAAKVVFGKAASEVLSAMTTSGA